MINSFRKMLIFGAFLVFLPGPFALGIGDFGIQNPSIENPSVGAPFSSISEPVSTYQQPSFVPQNFNPLTGNMIVTGNVGGGRQFRGSVPYGSIYDFQAPLSTTSLNSFLRYSTPAGQPYYSQTSSSVRPSGTLSTGISGLPQTPRIRSYQQQTEIFTPLGQTSSLPGSDTFIPISQTSMEREGTLLGQVQGYKSSQEFFEQEVENPQIIPQNLSTIYDEKTDFDKERSEVESQMLEDGSPQHQVDMTEQTQTQSLETEPDVYEQLKMQLGLNEDLRQSEQITDYMAANEKAEQEVEQMWEQKLETATDISSESVLEKIRKRRQERLAEGQTGGGNVPVEESTETTTEETETESQTQEKPADDIVVVPKLDSFTSKYNDQFNQSMKQAESYMKAGKYYQAADAYTYATLYKPLNPLGYIGKSHALFAAGEYVSSSRMLSTGIELFPDYTKIKVDLTAMIGNEELIKTRLVDLENWSVSTKSGELMLLLAYLNYQLDQNVKAEAAINQAIKSLPENEAVQALKKAIDRTRESK